jgi:outer membrane protein assembly factor BamB
MKILSVLALALLTIATNVHAHDWSGFRGPNASSYDPQASPPVEFDHGTMKNVAWKMEMPGRSVAGAIVVGDKVITTSSGGVDNQRIYITAVDLASGKRAWQQEMVCRGRPFSHPTSANAAPTPVSDGKNIYAFYSSNDLLCVDMNGQIVWYRSLSTEHPKLMNDVGMGSSPVIVNDVLVVQAEAPTESYLFGIDAKSGKSLWKIDRPKLMNWTTPVVIDADGPQPWVLTSGGDVIGVDPKTGHKLFTMDSPASTIPSAVASRDRVYVPVGGLTAYQIGSHGTTPTEIWKSKKLGPDNSSPVVVGDKLWVVKSSVLTQASTETGKDEWKLRLADAGSVWATPVICGDRAYIFGDSGRCFVVKIGGEKGELLATNELGDAVLGSPAVASDSLIVRSDRYLWKLSVN